MWAACCGFGDPRPTALHPGASVVQQVGPGAGGQKDLMPASSPTQHSNRGRHMPPMSSSLGIHIAAVRQPPNKPPIALSHFSSWAYKYTFPPQLGSIHSPSPSGQPYPSPSLAMAASICTPSTLPMAPPLPPLITCRQLWVLLSTTSWLYCWLCPCVHIHTCMWCPLCLPPLPQPQAVLSGWNSAHLQRQAHGFPCFSPLKEELYVFPQQMESPYSWSQPWNFFRAGTNSHLCKYCGIHKSIKQVILSKSCTKYNGHMLSL